MKTRFHAFLILMLLFFALPVLAQDSTEVPEVTPTIESVIVEDAGAIVPAEEAPAVVVIDQAENAFFNNDVMIVAGAGLLGILVGGAFLIALRAIDALKFTVPQEALAMMGQQLVEVLVKTRDESKRNAEKTDSPVDDVAAMLLSVPLNVIIQEIERRTGSVPIELLTHLGIAKEEVSV